MEKDLKDKKQEEKNTPKIPWTKLVPAAAVIAALVFSGIKAKGSDGETEADGQAETTVKKILFLTAQLPQLRKTVQQKRKAHRKKVQKKQQRKKAQVQERFPNLQKAMPVPQDREPRRHR